MAFRSNITRLGSKWAALLLFLLLFSWLIWSVVQSDERSLQFASTASSDQAPMKPTGGEIPIEGKLQTVAEDETLKLTVDLTNQLFMITDKRNGMQWRSSPLTSGQQDINPLGEQIAASPFAIAYSKNGKDEISTSLLTEKAEWTAYPISNGIQLLYNIKSIGISFIAEFTLIDGAFHIRIPEQGIKEEEQSLLTNIQVFPFIASARQGDAGYMVIPDGSGAITYFNRSHPNFNETGYSKWVYGSDPAFEQMTKPLISQRITLPVFGLIKEEGGFIARIVQGASDAQVVVSPPGVLNLNYYRGGLKFVYRKSYAIQTKKDAIPVKRIEKNRIAGDREIRFDFVAKTNASYADLAETLRKQYESEWGLFKQTANAPLIRVFTGAESRSDTLLQKMNVTSTFAEMIQMGEAFRQQGIADFAFSVAGWYQDGLYGKLPGSLSADSRFGGDDGLKQLLTWGEQQSVPISLEHDGLDIYHKEKNGVTLRQDAVRQPNGELYTYHPIKPSGDYYSVEWHLLSPRVEEQKYRKGLMDKWDEIGLQGVDLRYVGDTLFSDYNPEEPLRRLDTANYYRSWIKESASRLGQASIFYGYDYAAQFADRILETPMDTSSDYLLDEAIPLLQMVYHGLRPYYSIPVNRGSDPQKQLLRSLEFGGIPSYELTFRSSIDLSFTYYDRLFSSQYEDWMPEIQKAYEMWKAILQPLQELPMIEHQKITEHVFRTTYADGTVVWVNYGEQPFSPESGITIKALDYVMRKGDGW
ncbi:DUF5696 domain-containing protein [Paenibacillus eucommiae]|uniref:Uncharacterized protein n=1 Tax=Paenibacillus eucommiae TaxID=1355755 RepID=A0ABS4ILV2_9BACL|nr:DUF5696 domain-containing protein [Paenibacillus eucommiae]MBP1988483.1 hypothetical protein [Paenibacillus eucommiae]